MSFVVYKGEKNFRELVERVYGKLPAQDVPRAQAALVSANPHLRLRNLNRGAVLAVPTLPHLRPAPSRESGLPAQEVLTAVRAAFDAHRVELEASIEAEARAIAASSELLGSKEVRQVAKSVPDAVPYLEQADAALKQRVKELERFAGYVERLGTARAELDTLADRLGAR